MYLYIYIYIDICIDICIDLRVLCIYIDSVYMNTHAHRSHVNIQVKTVTVLLQAGACDPEPAQATAGKLHSAA